MHFDIHLKYKTLRYHKDTQPQSLFVFSLCLCVFVVCFITLPLPVQAACISNGCHTEIGQKQFVHSPVAEDECLSCHQKQKEVHPSGQGGDFILTSKGGSLCFTCHDDTEFNNRYKHGPAASGACMTCHDPHDSEQKSLLRMPLQEICLGCHSDFDQSMRDAKFIHSAIQKLDCSSCHMPHSSVEPKLLKKKGTELCFDCHKNLKAKYDSSLNKHKALYIERQCGNCHLAHYSTYSSLLMREGENLCYGCHGEDNSNRSEGLRNIRNDIEDKEVVHGPVADGECIACHDPHGNSYASILKGSYPQSFYAAYEENLYDFCFQCHDKELLTSETATNQTDFRNGDENLHYRHVARAQKGRTCRSCHSVHASNGQKLINPDGIKFGDWKIPIRFETTETGGSCMPGCHRGMSYDRAEYIDNSDKADGEKKERKIIYTPPPTK
ncbi:MAG: cytochrome c3 family protein [Desulfobulbaceae bacterium]|nr:cytochrome c3 family protein [Desulfobulbaceae bacterium]